MVKVAVLGTGMVGHALAGKLVSLGHEVTMGSRQAGNEKALAWAEQAGSSAGAGTFADAAAFGDLVVNATHGGASFIALQSAGAQNLAGKVLIDVANPLDASDGFPPILTVCNTDSLAEQIQRGFPDTRVVKTLNTMNAEVMVNPGSVPDHHVVFVSGNDREAKTTVVDLLRSFGWPAEDILDLGDITSARGAEMYVPLWLRLFGTLGSGAFNIDVRTG
jgi:predicted dinucleotide-binding enzyme